MALGGQPPGKHCRGIGSAQGITRPCTDGHKVLRTLEASWCAEGRTAATLRPTEKEETRAADILKSLKGCGGEISSS